MNHLQNKTKKQKQSEKITPIFEPRCQHGRFSFAAGGFMMYRGSNSVVNWAGETGVPQPASFRVSTRHDSAMAAAAGGRSMPLPLSMPW